MQKDKYSIFGVTKDGHMILKQAHTYFSSVFFHSLMINVPQQFFLSHHNDNTRCIMNNKQGSTPAKYTSSYSSTQLETTLTICYNWDGTLQDHYV